MKKVLFLFICFFCLSSIVLAEKYLYINDLEDGNPVLNETFTNVDIVSGFNGSGLDDLILSYYSKEKVLLESYGISYYAVSKYEHNIGLKCIDTYERAKSGSSFNCSLGQEGIYSSGRDISEIKYWKIFEYDHYDDFFANGTTSVYDFCLNNKETHNSRICSDLIFKSSFYYGTKFWHYVGFIEYNPVDFELVCDDNTKKGENVKCDLKVNATDEIKELTIPLKDESYELVNYNEVEGWKLVKNDDNTITLTSDKGFKGVSVVLNSELKISDQTTDEVNIEMNDISVTTVDENILDFTVNDKIILSNNSETKEDNKIENPNTVDVAIIAIVLFTFSVLIGIYLFKDMKRYE